MRPRIAGDGEPIPTDLRRCAFIASITLVTGVNRGKVYFHSWLMNVKIEGKNVVRHLDLTTHNHASQPGQTPPWPYTDSMITDELFAEEEQEQEDYSICIGAHLDGPKDKIGHAFIASITLVREAHHS